ncbi:hypothetical protein CDD83_5377 [Cordyceps sp. RAO-2017]|nr:hypothetical protein CDD83_5377 [Cordyceps sp. RAO-2017]
MAASSMVQGASLLVLLQLLSRLTSFAANQLLVRLLTARLLGLATQLDVLYLSVLFFARESLRVAIQRQAPSPPAIRPAAAEVGGDKARDATEAKRREEQREREDERRGAQAVVNLGYLPVLVGAVVAVVLARLYRAYLVVDSSSSLGDDDGQPPQLVLALGLYALAAWVELLSEPCFVLMHTRLRFGTRAAAESAATLTRCLVVLGAALWASSEEEGGGRGVVGVLPFALGQLAYGLALLLVYLVAGRRLAAQLGFSLLPRRLGGGKGFVLGYFDAPALRLAASITAQSVVKHVLTQGDTFLVSLLAEAEVQGVYALANNYGGLLARLLFQPVEESCRSYFSRLLSSSSPAAAAASSRSPAAVEARRSLATLSRLYLVLSAAVVAVGPFAAPALLAVVAGSRWTAVGAGRVLATYCFYVPFLALNGLAESFVASVASERQLHRQSLWMGAFSVAFAAAAYVLMRLYPLGAHGLVLANVVNMLCRILWSTAFVKTFFAARRLDFSLASLLPGPTIAASLATFAALVQLHDLDEAGARPFVTLAKVAASAVPLLLVIGFSERTLLLECFHSVRGREFAKP